MKLNLKKKNQIISAAIGSMVLIGTNASMVHANTSTNPLSFLDKYGIKLGGWVHGGATFNPYITDGFNGPVTFADQANRVQLNQFNLFLERAVVTEGKKWDVGFRADFMFGTDAIFTQAYGNPGFDVNNGRALDDRGNWDLDICCKSLRTYGIAIPQTYAEIYAPFGNGLNVKVGHFYTPIGYESVPAPNNFFYTHAYTSASGYAVIRAALRQKGVDFDVAFAEQRYLRSHHAVVGAVLEGRTDVGATYVCYGIRGNIRAAGWSDVAEDAQFHVVAESEPIPNDLLAMGIGTSVLQAEALPARADGRDAGQRGRRRSTLVVPGRRLRGARSRAPRAARLADRRISRRRRQRLRRVSSSRAWA